jgi:hypothetical protein
LPIQGESEVGPGGGLLNRLSHRTFWGDFKSWDPFGETQV